MSHIKDRSRQVLGILAVAIIMASALSTGASAQLGLFYGNSGNNSPSLGQADLIQSDRAAIRLLEPQPAPVGTSEAWSEPTSGNSGLLTMESEYVDDGNPCRVIRWHAAYKAGAERTLMLKTCRVAGTWKLM